MSANIKRVAKTIGIGVCDAYFYPEGTDIPIYLGYTKEGVQVDYEQEFHELTSDQTGNTPLDDVLIGEKVKVETNLLDTSLEKIAALFPSATAVQNDKGISAVTFGRSPGLRITDYSGKLVLHPISAGNSKERDVIIHRTANTGNLSLAFKLDEEWKIPVIFKGYWDDHKPEGDRLFRIGEEGTYGGDYRKVVKFWITPSNPEIAIGETVTFKANAMFEDGTTEDVTSNCSWAIADDSKATLVESGQGQVATGIAAGSTVVRAEYVGYANATTLVVNA